MRPSGQPPRQLPLSPLCLEKDDNDMTRSASTSRRNAEGHSQFTQRHLADMAAAVPSCPLRVVAHIDLDAYYAQCEMLRLGSADDTPLAVQQWRNLIAVNYPARAFGIGRMVTAVEARRLCPDLVLQHVPTWKEGETLWAYHNDADKAMQTHKVSLEPYRIRSREILATIKASLPAGRCRIEKAGIDEVFIDLSPCVHDVLVNERYPELLADYRNGTHGSKGGVSSLQVDTPLPLPPFSSAAELDWAATGSGVVHPSTGSREGPEGEGHGRGRDGIVGGSRPPSDMGSNYEADGDYEGSRDYEDVESPDWDDVVMLEGARIVRAIRTAIYERLRFRCSAGIASNKLISKLGSSQHKPDRQTVVRPRAVGPFLESLSSVTRLRGLGGKLGSRVVAAFDTQSIAELRTVTLDQMQSRLAGGAGGGVDSDTAHYLYWLLRGVDHSEVTSRTDIKSLISAKSFQPPLASHKQACRWLRVFAAELRCRLLDERLSQALLEAATIKDADEGGWLPSSGVEEINRLDTSVASGIAGTTGTPGTLGTPGNSVTSGTLEISGTSNAPVETPSGGIGRARKDESNIRNSGQQQTQVQAQMHNQMQQRQKQQHHLPQKNARIPQTIRLHYGTAGHWRSRQMRIPRDGSPLDEEKLLRLGTALLDQAHRHESLWPCPHLAISLNGFEEPLATGSKSIAAFFHRKSAPENAESATCASPQAPVSDGQAQGACDDGHDDNGDYDDDSDGHHGHHDHHDHDGCGCPDDHADDHNVVDGVGYNWPRTKRRKTAPGVQAALAEGGPLSEQLAATSSTLPRGGRDTKWHSANTSSDNISRRGRFQCDHCHDTSFDTATQMQEHQDWHVARALQAKERVTLLPPSSSATRNRGTGMATMTMVSSTHSARSRGAIPKRTNTPISSFFIQKSSSGVTGTHDDVDRTGTTTEASKAGGDTQSDESGSSPASRTLVCSRCMAEFDQPNSLQVHKDWHFATDLARQ